VDIESFANESRLVPYSRFNGVTNCQPPEISVGGELAQEYYMESDADICDVAGGMVSPGVSETDAAGIFGSITSEWRRANGRERFSSATRRCQSW